MAGPRYARPQLQALCIKMNWRIVKLTSIPFMALLALAFIAGLLVSSFVEYGHKSTEFIGCYSYDAMLVGFECQGFMGSNLVALWLNWPLWLLYGPIFAFLSIRVLAITILIWLPVVAFVVSTFKLRRAKNA